ncbi:MAG: methylmalonyl Co-A mutase-associated GTPase MeaB, partial [Myxococcales bacterium]|nr:methylmalonyl Co-A mutase-associated GTPase MeaB [Myxococcales bacterium]
DNVESARRAQRDYAAALALLSARASGWRAPVLTCSALEGCGLDEIWQRVVAHGEAARQSGELSTRRAQQQVRWMWSMLEEALLARLHAALQQDVGEVERKVRAGELTASAAARQLLESFDRETSR